MKIVEVAIALVWRDQKLLVTQRPEGIHLGGLWEFPGGKLASGESPETCAEREVLEEVGLQVRARARRDSIRHEYPERRVLLHPIDCDYVDGELELREVSDARWLRPAELGQLAFPEANRDLIAELVATG
ncbi:MAG: (deoxy)nucleoside triphosphate pyrophosphohydrolase [Myxococcota bacterium]